MKPIVVECILVVGLILFIMGWFTYEVCYKDYIKYKHSYDEYFKRKK